MKRYCFYIILGLLHFMGCNAYAQSRQLNEEMKRVFDACVSLRAAIASGSDELIRDANKVFKECDIVEFNTLRPHLSEQISLDGHYIFDEVFIDSLIVNDKVLDFAQRYAKDRSIRGTEDPKGKVQIKNCAVKANSVMKYSYVASNHLEIAVVTEPGGKITMNLVDRKRKEYCYKETKNLRHGQDTRFAVLDFEKNTSIIVEITNESDKDISFVIISN